MDKSLAVRNTLSMADISTAATAMVKSGFFSDAKDASQAMVKIMAGQEMGFGAFASMTGIYIIQGKPTVGANLMAAAVKGNGKYDYRVIEMSDTVCEIAFLQTGKEIGRSRFTVEDAKKAQTKNLDKFPRNMLFARAMSNGVRWYCPDVFNGSPVYTPEELGATVDMDGEVIDMPAPAGSSYGEHFPIPSTTKPIPATIVEAAAELGGEMTMSLEMANSVQNSKGQLYGDCDTTALTHMANTLAKKIAEGGYEGDELQDKKMRLDACRVILASRK